MNTTVILKKLTSATLSLMLVFGASIPSYSQAAPKTGNLFDYDYTASPTGVPAEEKTVIVSFEQLEDAFNNSDASVARLKKHLNALGVADNRIAGVITSAISFKTNWIKDLSELNKNYAANVSIQIEDMERQIKANPDDGVLALKKWLLREDKAHFLNKVRKSYHQAAHIDEILVKLYNTDREIAALIDQVTPSMDKTLYKNITRLSAAPKGASAVKGVHGGGIWGLGLVFVTSFIGISLESKAIPPATTNYTKTINHQRAMLKTIENTPSLIPAIYANADKTDKKTILNLSYNNNVTARDMYITADIFAYTLDNLTTEQLKDFAARAKTLLSDYDQEKAALLRAKINGLKTGIVIN